MASRIAEAMKNELLRKLKDYEDKEQLVGQNPSVVLLYVNWLHTR